MSVLLFFQLRFAMAIFMETHSTHTYVCRPGLKSHFIFIRPDMDSKTMTSLQCFRQCHRLAHGMIPKYQLPLNYS